MATLKVPMGCYRMLGWEEMCCKSQPQHKSERAINIFKRAYANLIYKIFEYMYEPSGLLILNLPRCKLKQIVSSCKNFFLAELNEIKDRLEAERRRVRGGKRARLNCKFEAGHSWLVGTLRTSVPSCSYF